MVLLLIAAAVAGCLHWPQKVLAAIAVAGAVLVALVASRLLLALVEPLISDAPTATGHITPVWGQLMDPWQRKAAMIAIVAAVILGMVQLTASFKGPAAYLPLPNKIDVPQAR